MLVFFIWLGLGAIAGSVCAVLSWLEQQGKTPWQNGNETEMMHNSGYKMENKIIFEYKKTPKKLSEKCDGD